MNKKIIIGIIGLIVLLFGIFAAGCGATAYITYSNAFKQTFDVDSMELKTTVKASLDGGTSITSTGTFKLKDMKSANAPQFLNIMEIDGKTITQFCDGNNVYTDDGQSKNKMALGNDSKPADNMPQEHEQKNNSAFTYEAYISEFSSMIDAGKIKEMSSIEPIAEKYVVEIKTSSVSGGKQYDVELLPAFLTEIKSSFLNESADSANSPEVEADSIAYSAIIKNGFVDEITFTFGLSIKAPGDDEAKKADVILTLKPVNPGQEVSFDLPSTDGF